MTQSKHPVAIITGAGSGIGRAASIQLANHNYRLILVGRRLESLKETGELLSSSGAHWHAIDADISVSQDRSRITHEAISQFGRIDALVNNAAIGTCKPISELSEDEIRYLYEINAIGPTDLVRRLLPSLTQSSGCVVNIASVAMLDPFVGLGIYGCTKAAIDALTRAIHNEYNDAGVRAYTIAPGAVETDMLRSIVSTDVLPATHTLTTETIASEISKCILELGPNVSGSTIILNSQ
ncbi:MAG: SDR family NAD(P)-dependent oxidoreductase [Phycisphaerales bacterium]|nr:SDR family NAD(P)-dependent oxidoreductase [Phycisphaerales bacterium]